MGVLFFLGGCSSYGHTEGEDVAGGKIPECISLNQDASESNICTRRLLKTQAKFWQHTLKQVHGEGDTVYL